MSRTLRSIPRPAADPAADPAGRPAPGFWPPARSRVAAVPAAALAIVLVGGLAGCAKFNAALGQETAVVQFKSGTSNVVRLKVRAACSHIPGTKAMPLPTDHLAVDVLNDVRFQVGSASDAEQTRLTTCVMRFPSVTGVNFETPGDS